MARKSNGPWYWGAKNGWFVWHNGKRLNLKVKGEGNEPEAVRAWHRLMADGPKEVVKVEPKAEATVKSVLEAFLADAKARVKANTYATYHGLLTAFKDAHGEAKADGLKLATVYAYANRSEWSASYRHGLLGSIATAWKWGESVGLIGSNSLKGMKRPPKASRGVKAVVNAEAHVKLLEASTPSLRLLLTLLQETGARPSELARLTAQDVDLANGVAILNEHKSDAHGKPRLILLSPKAIGILKALAEANPEGTLLRNARGGKWTKDGIGLAVRRARKRAGVAGIAYGYRHTFATDALVNGLPDAHVAALLGHSGTAMLHRHYSHLTSRTDVLRDALAKVRA